jgi:hypothetical protein
MANDLNKLHNTPSLSGTTCVHYDTFFVRICNRILAVRRINTTSITIELTHL